MINSIQRSICSFLFFLVFTHFSIAQSRPNILLIVADDLNFNSVGAFGSPVNEITPNLDQLANEGIRFTNAHMSVAVCQPSRGALMTGQYGHQSGIEGFEHYKGSQLTLTELLRNGGYETAILGKLNHSLPKRDSELSQFYLAKDLEDLGMGRDPQLYYEYSNEFFEHVKEVEKPFFFMVNSRDPHRPFAGSRNEKSGEFRAFFESGKSYPSPSKTYTEEEISIPGFLPDLPDVRTEIAQYFSSVKRFDDMIGKLMQSLRENDMENNTLILFVSDNGMAFPYSKTNCYLQSTKTPFIAKWPGQIKAGSMDSIHFISGIDFLPTLLEVGQIETSQKMAGKSFLSLLKGHSQANRGLVFTQFYETSGFKRFLMRAVQTRKYGYIFNPWVLGDNEFANESMQGLTFNAMKESADQDTFIKSRVDFFLNRSLEEFYDFENDPNALHNLIDDPKFQNEIELLREELKKQMIISDDPVLKMFELRKQPVELRNLVLQDQKNTDAER